MNPLSPTDVVRELIALAVVEHTHTPGTRITVELHGQGVTITDTGRGMQLAPDPGDTIPHAQRALTSPYPCLPADPDVGAVLTDLVWGERGSLGPSPANAACRAFEFTSRRDGEAWTQRFEHGIPAGPPERAGTTTATGTVIRCTTDGPVDAAAINRLIAELRRRVRGLDLERR